MLQICAQDFHITKEIGQAFLDLSDPVREEVKKNKGIVKSFQELNQLEKINATYKKQLAELEKLPPNKVEKLEDKMLPEEITQEDRERIIEVYNDLVEKDELDLLDKKENIYRGRYSIFALTDCFLYLQSLRYKNLNDLICCVYKKQIKETFKKELHKEAILEQLKEYRVIELADTEGFSEGNFDFITNDKLKKILKKFYNEVFLTNSNSELTIENFKEKLDKSLQYIPFDHKDAVKTSIEMIYYNGWNSYVKAHINDLKIRNVRRGV